MTRPAQPKPETDERKRFRALSPHEYERSDGTKVTHWTQIGRAIENRGDKGTFTLYITPHIAATGRVVLVPISDDDDQETGPGMRRFDMDPASDVRDLI